MSQQLKVLRESGFATVRGGETRRVYAVDAHPLAAVDAWLERFRRLWGPGLEALRLKLPVASARNEGAVEPGPPRDGTPT